MPRPRGSRSERLRQEADPIWAAQLEHPFIRGIADGSLDAERFRHFIRQDYLFLREYARALSLASAKSPRLEWQRRFAALARETLETEMSLHRDYAAEWGISAAELEAERPASTTRAYTNLLLASASTGDFAELAAALLPCMWGYSWLGGELAAEVGGAASTYSRWIESYADPEFAELAAWCRGVVDEADGDDARIREAFLASSRYELAFWDAAWRLEPAPF